MHSDCESAESIADWDLEDGELRKMLASPLFLQHREDCEPSRMPIAQVKLAALLLALVAREHEIRQSQGTALVVREHEIRPRGSFH